MANPVNHYKVVQLPSTLASSSIYFLKGASDDRAKVRITSDSSSPTAIELDYGYLSGGNNWRGEQNFADKLSIPQSAPSNAQAGRAYIHFGNIGQGGVTPPAYTLSPATTSELGGVIVGSGLKVANDGTISVDGDIFDLTNYYTKTEVDAKLSSVYRIMPSVNTVGDLPQTGNVLGDTRNVRDTGMNYVWVGGTGGDLGNGWDSLGGVVDMSEYYTKTESDGRFALRTRTLTGTGAITGGGSLASNRTFDLTQETKDDIAKGVTAHGWGDFRDYGLGRDLLNQGAEFADGLKDTMFWRAVGANSGFPTAVAAIHLRYDGSRASEIAISSTAGSVRLYLRNWDGDNGVWGDHVEVWHDGNLRSNTDNDARYLRLTTNQTVAGQKTFTLPPLLSADATSGNHATRLSQVTTLIENATSWSAEEW